MSRPLQKILYGLAGIGILIILWEVMANSESKLIPHSWQILNEFKNLFCTKSSLLDLKATLSRTLVSFAIAVLFGLPLGLFIGSSRILEQMFHGPLHFFRSLPAFILLPLFLCIFKKGEYARISMIAFGAGLIIVTNTAFAIAHVRKLRTEVAQVYGASNIFILFNVIGREIAPQAIDGCRLALSLSLVLSIVGEIMLGATYGLGTRINDNLYGFNLPYMYALIVLVGFLGYLLNCIGTHFVSKTLFYGKHL
jgi:NitT/TauT family transport system permease protein